MKTFKKNNTINRVIALALALVIAVSLVTPVEAATYNVGNQQLSIVNGMATVTTNGQTSQLTKALVASDGAIDSKTGIIYILWMSGSVYWYSSKDGYLPHYLVNGVTTIEFNGSDPIAFSNANGRVRNVLTTTEVDATLNPSSNSNNNGNNTNTGNSTGNNNTNTGNSNNNNGNTNNGNNSSSTTPIIANGQSVSLENNSAIVSITENGSTKKIVLATSKVINLVLTDSIGTVYVGYTDASLYAWNYSVQRNNTALVKVADNISNPVVYNGKLLGYYIQNDSTFHPTLSLTQLKDAVAKQSAPTTGTTGDNTTTPTNTTTNNTTIITDKNYKKFAYSLTDGRNVLLYDSNGNVVDKVTLAKNGVLKYRGWNIKSSSTKNKIAIVRFTKKGDVIFRFKSGKTRKIDHTTFEIKTVNKNVKGFRYTKGMVKGYKLKSGKVTSKNI